MRPRPVHPTPLAWARHAAGEGHGLSGWRFRRHLAGCAACRRLEAELVRERAEFEASPRRGEDLRLLQAAASRPGGAPIPRRATAPRLRPLAAAMPAVALLAVVTALALRDERSSLREKGGSALMLFVDRPAGPEPLGERCAPGDRLIARYRTDLPYLLLLQRDGPGAVQVLFPQDGAASGKLPAGEGTTPTSFILDEAPGPECFAAFFSDAPLAARPLLDLFARSAAPAAVPGAVVRVSCCAKGATR